MTDMSIALSVVIVSWVYAYVQIHQTVYIFFKETGLQPSAFSMTSIFFLIKWIHLIKWIYVCVFLINKKPTIASLLNKYFNKKIASM